MINFAGNELAFVHVAISQLSENTFSVFWKIRMYIRTASWFPYKYGQIRTGRQVCCRQKDFPSVQKTIDPDPQPLLPPSSRSHLLIPTLSTFNQHPQSHLSYPTPNKWANKQNNNSDTRTMQGKAC